MRIAYAEKRSRECHTSNLPCCRKKKKNNNSWVLQYEKIEKKKINYIIYGAKQKNIA